jgi:hypothetical protein
MNCNLVGSIYGRSSLKSANFVLIHYQTWLPQAILVSDWFISKKSPPLKPLGQMNRNLVGSIYGMSSMKNAHFVPMWWPRLLTDRDEMSNLHRGHSIDASYQVSVVAMFANRSG